MMSRLVIVLAAVLLFGGVATNLTTTTTTTQTVEAKKNNKNNHKKDRKDKREKRQDRRDKRQDRNAVKAFSYINPDTGLATENADVNPNSECETPDQQDTQQLSDPGQTNRNVHNDACLKQNGDPVDTAVSFVISGVGMYSGCPDPDGAGPKTSAIMDGGKRCYLTGYQETGMDGDQEYHSRVNNDSQPGTSNVTFCSDPNNNGCSDAKVKDQIQIVWQS